MKKQRAMLAFSLAAVCSIMIGCGNLSNATHSVSTQTVQKQTNQSTHTVSIGDNPPFSVQTSQDIVKPVSTWDAKSVSSTTYDHVKVVDSSGKPVILSASNQPLLFEAYWCPHCQRTLLLLTKNKSSISKMPILISTGFEPNTTIQQAVYLSHQEFKTLKIKGFKVYYLLNDTLSAKYVPSFPTLFFQHNGKIETIDGEHTLSLWKQALS